MLVPMASGPGLLAGDAMLMPQTLLWLLAASAGCRLRQPGYLVLTDESLQMLAGGFKSPVCKPNNEGTNKIHTFFNVFAFVVLEGC